MVSPVLILFAHPAVEASRVNAPMRAAVTDLEDVTVHDLYETYPDFDIDVPREQALMEAHDVIVFHHPFYWYNCPALLKEWLDLVLTRGWAFGADATALRGKRLLSAVSTGGSSRAYTKKGASRYTVRDFLLPFDQTAHLCGMTYLEPLVFHGTHDAGGGQIREHADAFRTTILALRGGAG